MKKKIIIAVLVVVFVLIALGAAGLWLGQKYFFIALAADVNEKSLTAMMRQEERLLGKLINGRGIGGFEERLGYIQSRKEAKLEDMEILGLLVEQYNYWGKVACEGGLGEEALKEVAMLLLFNETLIWGYNKLQYGDKLKLNVGRENCGKAVYIPERLASHYDVNKGFAEKYPDRHQEDMSLQEDTNEARLKKLKTPIKPTMTKWREGGGFVVGYYFNGDLDEFIDTAADYYSTIGYEKLTFDPCNPFKECLPATEYSIRKNIYFKGTNGEVVCLQLTDLGSLKVTIIVSQSSEHLINLSESGEDKRMVSFRRCTAPKKNEGEE